MPFPNGMTSNCRCTSSNCSNTGKQGSCYMYSFDKRRFALNYTPGISNNYGLKLLFNNNKFTLTSSNKGAVGSTSLGSRAYR